VPFCTASWALGLKSEIKLLKQEIKRRNEEIESLEVKAAFYKKQLVLESRFGWILESFL
jgi:hypothetical protein